MADNESTGNESESEDDPFGDEDEEDPVLTVHLENEEGDPVSEGVVATITGEASGVSATHNHGEEIENGEIRQMLSEGTWTVTVEPEEDGAFESREEDVEVEGNEEVTIELEGAPGDEPAESEETDGEGAESEEEDDTDGNESDDSETESDDEDDE